MKKLIILLTLIALIPIAYASVQIPLTITWNPIMASFYTGTICLEDTNLFGTFDSISVGYTFDDQSSSPPSPRIVYLIDKGNNRYCNDLKSTLWDSNNPDTVSSAIITIKNNQEIIYQDDPWSISVPNSINEPNHVFNAYLTTTNISLNKGWNLISIPLIPLDNNVNSTFGSLNYYNLFSYDSGWEVPTEINVTRGYWIGMDKEEVLTVQGYRPESSSISLSQGWNLIGYPGLEGEQISQMYGNATAFMYNNSNWYSYNSNRVLNSLNRFTPGLGYWIKK